MSLVARNKAFLVAEMEVDGQHAQRLEVFAELLAAMVGGAPHYAATAILSRLIEYTGEHFRSEVQQMADMEFSGLDSHRRDHRILLTQATLAHAQLSSSNALLSLTTLEFHRQWLLERTERRDRALGAFLAASGAQVARSEVARVTNVNLLADSTAAFLRIGVSRDLARPSGAACRGKNTCRSRTARVANRHRRMRSFKSGGLMKLLGRPYP